AVFFQADDGIREFHVTGVQTCALPISEDELGNPITAPYCWAPATARDDYSAANTADSDVPVDVFANDTFAQSVCRGGNLGLTHRTEGRRAGQGGRTREDDES